MRRSDTLLLSSLDATGSTAAEPAVEPAADAYAE
jgi:hypothetical protein